MTPAEIAEQLRKICPELSDLDVEELVIQQESAFLYVENNKFKGDQILDYGSVIPVQENESPYTANLESQLAMDEDLARALEFEDDFDNLYVSEKGDRAADDDAESSYESTIGETSNMAESRNVREDHIDPDQMSYEELQELGESVGSESRGLPAHLISQLPTFLFKSNSNKTNQEKEECVICCGEYKTSEELTSLPCAHRYHSNCIARWLQMKKHCPVCQKEVFEE